MDWKGTSIAELDCLGTLSAVYSMTLQLDTPFTTPIHRENDVARTLDVHLKTLKDKMACANEDVPVEPEETRKCTSCGSSRLLSDSCAAEDILVRT